MLSNSLIIDDMTDKPLVQNLGSEASNPNGANKSE